MSLSSSGDKKPKIVQLPGLQEVAEYNGDVIIPGGFDEDSEAARIKRLEEVAKETVRKANSQAEAILAEAKTQADNLRKQATEQGYLEGQTLGKTEYDTLMMQQKQDFAKMMGELGEYRDNMFESIKGNMGDIMTYLAKRILHHTFDESDEPINSMIHHTVERLRDQASITLKISLEDFGKLDVEGMEKDGVKIEMDEKLGHGDIIIETEVETIDMGLDGQLDRLNKEIRD